jgi:hypothetical protein
MVSRAVKAGPARVRSAATTTADRNEAFRHEEAPASVAVDLAAASAVTMAAVAGVTNLNLCEPRSLQNSELERSPMLRKILNFDKFRCPCLPKIGAVALLLMACLAASSVAHEKGHKTFASSEEASHALLTAIQSNKEKAILNVLGQDARQIVSSGDEVEDEQDRENFVQKYEQLHRLVKEPDGTTTLYIGAENWPTPIPLVNNGDSWYFDTEAGKREILYRRIGRNEMSTFRVCQELVAAEKDYYSAQNNEFAGKILSDEGKHNGLYWRVADGEPQSPIGPLIASAVAEGYARRKDGAPTPYRGYYYRILTRQGKEALGGAKSYFVNGKMTAGFAFVAYPAEYKSSGVMTFLVGEDGVVYQKDLGKKTEVLAKAIKEYNPNSSWQKVEDEQEETASEQKTK